MQDPVRDAIERLRDGEPVLDDGRLLLRVGLAVVFVWLGVDKFVRPTYWAMWVPDLLGFLATTPGLFAIGIFEVAVGLALAFGVRLRATALVASAFLALVVVTQGVEPVVRDVGLLAAALYLGLTTPGPTPREGPTSSTLPDLPPIPTPSRRGAGAAVLVAVLVVVGGAIAVVGPSFQTGPRDTGPLLTIAEPANGTQVAAGDLPVTVTLAPRVHEVGVDHVHIKVDGWVLDAVYFDPGQDRVSTTVHVDEGERTIGAYLAYTDHVEYEDSWTQVTVEAR